MTACKHCGKGRTFHADRRLLLGSSYVTPREMQIIKLYCAGKPLSVICAKLGIAKSTVESLTRTARLRLGLGNNYELVALYASSDLFIGRGRSSNQDALYSGSAPGTAPSRAL